MNKYYWFLASYRSDHKSEERKENGVIDVHPFEWLWKLINQYNFYDCVLLNWQEITKEEYELFVKLNG